MNQPPTWAGRSVPTEESGAVAPAPQDDGKNPVLPIVGAVALVILVGGAGFLLGRGNNDDVATDEVPAVTTTSAALDEDDQISTSLTTVPETESDSETSDDTVADDTEGDTGDTADDIAEAADIERRAVLKSGKLYLRGLIPSAEIGEAIVARAGAVVGPDNVVNEYVVDSDAPFPESAPLYVEDLVLFAYGSEEINPAFIPLLDLGTALMTQNPQVIVTVVSHTDANGSEEFNQALSQRRGDSVKKYWTDLGINPDQIIVDARGETSPIADNNTPDGAQLNRRAEFIIANLLG